MVEWAMGLAEQAHTLQLPHCSLPAELIPQQPQRRQQRRHQPQFHWPTVMREKEHRDLQPRFRRKEIAAQSHLVLLHPHGNDNIAFQF